MYPQYRLPRERMYSSSAITGSWQQLWCGGGSVCNGLVILERDQVNVQAALPRGVSYVCPRPGMVCHPKISLGIREERLPSGTHHRWLELKPWFVQWFFTG